MLYETCARARDGRGPSALPRSPRRTYRQRGAVTDPEDRQTPEQLNLFDCAAELAEGQARVLGGQISAWRAGAPRSTVEPRVPEWESPGRREWRRNGP